MFTEAYNLASRFTRPVMISMHYFDNTVETGLGSCVLINDQGWILTAAHLLQPITATAKSREEMEIYNQQVRMIEEDTKLSVRGKRERIAKLKSNPKWIKNCLYTFSAYGTQMKNIKILPEIDLAVGQLDPYLPPDNVAYARIKNPESMPYGRSLCKFGFPFAEIATSFNESTNQFIYPENLVLPLFPIEGLHTRYVEVANKSKPYTVKYLETSTPGLKGQSGGPTVDADGNVWAIQSRTAHLALGFAPKIKREGKEIEENQFLNVGLGVHAETIVSFLREHSIDFVMSED